MRKVPDETYNANGLLNAVISRHHLKNDAALARMLGVAPPVISKLRGHNMPVGPTMILKLHEICGFQVADIRTFIGGAA